MADAMRGVINPAKFSIAIRCPIFFPNVDSSHKILRLSSRKACPVPLQNAK